MFVARSRALQLACRPNRARFPRTQLVLAPYSRQAPAVPQYSTSSEAAAESQTPTDESNVPGHDGAKQTPESSGSTAATIASTGAGIPTAGTFQREGQPVTKKSVIRLVRSAPESVATKKTAGEPTKQPMTAIENQKGFSNKPAPTQTSSPKNTASKTSPASWQKGRPHISAEINGQDVFFEPVHLRDSCTCSRCIHPSTKQRTFETAQIPLNIFAKGFRMDKGSLTVEWENDIQGFEGHTSTYSTKYLRTLTSAQLGSRSADPRSYWNCLRFQKTEHWFSYNDYMNDDKKFRSAMVQLHRYGLLFLKGVPEDTESVSKIANRIGPIKNTFYGSTWDVRNIPDPKNVAYTNVDLGFHMDLLYLIQPPGLQFLHCMKNELPGGESLFADSFFAANLLRQMNKQHFEFLTDAWMSFGYENDNQSYRATRKIINLANDEAGDIKDINYSPPFQAPSWCSGQVRGQYYTRLAQALKHFKSILESKNNIFELKMNPGECVIFQNRRVVHARRAFGGANPQSGDRWLRGCYIDEDVALSKYKTLGI